ncbi:hypothetical protein TorRG33x02_116760 [Trema orientale]|uniref:Uncharacterized protein n=1 Tax=Trema orientale TaxID=63057 RepID=A0A2P5F487_TREOI|nr:hypothetical protein TorRG33x02_116760 [Trema orientale]
MSRNVPAVGDNDIGGSIFCQKHCGGHRLYGTSAPSSYARSLALASLATRERHGPARLGVGPVVRRRCGLADSTSIPFSRALLCVKMNKLGGF